MGRNKIEHDNSEVVEALADYATWGKAAEEYPWLDSILAGACLLDHDGNSRPLKMGNVYTLLSTLPMVSTEAIQSAIGCSSSHAARLRVAVRIVSSAFLAKLAIHRAMEASKVEEWRRRELRRREYSTVTERAPAPPATVVAPRSPQEVLTEALARCHRDYGKTLFTALHAYGGDIGALVTKIIGPCDDRALVEAGVLLVEHDVDAPVRPPVFEPPYSPPKAKLSKGGRRRRGRKANREH